MSKDRRSGPRPFRASWLNIFMLVLGFATVIYIFNPQGVMWLRGVAYTTLLLGAVFLIVRALQTRMSRARETIFILGGGLVAYAMMQPDIQGWFHDTIPLYMTPLGLADANTGQVLVNNWWLIAALLFLLGVGIYLTPKNEPEAW